MYISHRDTFAWLFLLTQSGTGSNNDHAHGPRRHKQQRTRYRIIPAGGVPHHITPAAGVSIDHHMVQYLQHPGELRVPIGYVRLLFVREGVDHLAQGRERLVYRLRLVQHLCSSTVHTAKRGNENGNTGGGRVKG